MSPHGYGDIWRYAADLKYVLPVSDEMIGNDVYWWLVYSVD